MISDLSELSSDCVILNKEKYSSRVRTHETNSSDDFVTPIKKKKKLTSSQITINCQQSNCSTLAIKLESDEKVNSKASQNTEKVISSKKIQREYQNSFSDEQNSYDDDALFLYQKKKKRKIKKIKSIVTVNNKKEKKLLNKKNCIIDEKVLSELKDLKRQPLECSLSEKESLSNRDYCGLDINGITVKTNNTDVIKADNIDVLDLSTDSSFSIRKKSDDRSSLVVNKLENEPNRNAIVTVKQKVESSPLHLSKSYTPALNSNKEELPRAAFSNCLKKKRLTSRKVGLSRNSNFKSLLFKQ
ncbi:hypothetical protein HDU92_003858 [Lobulomyces angularis]|nr:hypothetical protein HDU92_003858 [Lobulomyces angularis]